MSGLRYLVPLALVTGLFVLPGIAAGDSASATVSFAGNATLVSSPGPAEVTLHYSCLPPSPGLIQAELDENGVLGISLAEPATCDGQNHSVTLIVDGLFTPGTASGLAIVNNPDFSSSAFTEATVAIK
jgi:hypothetical protein